MQSVHCVTIAVPNSICGLFPRLTFDIVCHQDCCKYIVLNALNHHRIFFHSAQLYDSLLEYVQLFSELF